MAVTKKGDYSYGENPDDLREVLKQYSESTGYPIDHFADAKCVCGANLFELHTDELQGVAGRVCVACGHEHVMADGADYVDKAELEVNECLCGEEHFEITAGVHLYREEQGLSDVVRWFYIGCRCPECNMMGCYADWKNEFQGFRELLDNV